MVGDLTLCKFSCNMSRNRFDAEWRLASILKQRGFFLAARQKCCETSCKRNVTLCNALQQSLQKVD